MSRLEKYARPRMDKNTRQYSVKVPESDGQEFEDYCKELNIKPAEAIRYLIQDELEFKRNKKKSEDIKKIANETSATTERIQKNTLKKSTGMHAGDRQYLKSLKIDGKLPCPICHSWQSTAHFSRHAKTHGHSSTLELLRTHSESAKAMYKQKISHSENDA